MKKWIPIAKITTPARNSRTRNPMMSKKFMVLPLPWARSICVKQLELRFIPVYAERIRSAIVSSGALTTSNSTLPSS
jgi:hypothetical protein